MRASEEFRRKNHVFLTYAPAWASDTSPFIRLAISQNGADGTKQKLWHIDIEYRASAIETNSLDQPVKEDWRPARSAPEWEQLTATQVLDIALDVAAERKKDLLEFLGLPAWHAHKQSQPIPPVIEAPDYQDTPVYAMRA